MSLKQFKEFVLPGLQRVINIAKERDIPLLEHCEGYIWPLLGILVHAGIEAYHQSEPTAGTDIGEVKSTYGDRMAVIGNFDCAHLLDVRYPLKMCETQPRNACAR